MEHVFLTGSYDEELRYFDKRSPKSSLCNINLYGGIWRIKQHPFNKQLLVTANMYKNFSVIKLDNKLPSFNICAEYFEHKSICYGVDWCPEIENDKYYLSTCSFYDHKLCLSKYTLLS